MSSFRTQKIKEGTVIEVPQNFKANTGECLGEIYVLGEKLGEGMYGAVYDVLVQSQQPSYHPQNAGLVFKCLKMGQTSEKSGLLREWIINEKLNKLKYGMGEVSGYMYAGAGVFRVDGKFIGMILEKMNGWTIRKRIRQKTFHDIHYICFMLQDVFEALQLSQNQLGFHHADLHLGNIMEQHNLSSAHQLQRQKSKKKWTISGLTYNPEQDLQNYNLSDVRFKIIDFGHSWFLNMDGQQNGLSEIGQSAESRVLGPIQENQAQQNSQRFDEENDQTKNGASQNENVQKEYQQLTEEQVKTHKVDRSKFKPQNLTAKLRAEITALINLEMLHNKRPTSESTVMLRTSFTEKVYRMFWCGKGDVYRLLLSLAAQMDCRVWDTEDQELVEGVLKLFQYILGVQVQRQYVDNLEEKLNLEGSDRRRSVKYSSVWYRWFRRSQIRMHALLASPRPGILASDALQVWYKFQTELTLNPNMI